MNNNDRLMLISAIAYHFHDRSDDGYWIIGMLCDPTLPEDKFKQHIKETKEMFPEIVDIFTRYNL